MKRFRKTSRQSGFTMIELMVVVIIVGVLAAIAIPIYGKYIKNSRITEATSRIGEIITAAKAYAQENQDVNGNPTWPPAGGSGIVDVATNTDLFSYAITAGGGANASTTALTVVGTGLAGEKMAGVTVTVTVPDINSNGNPPVIAGL